MQQCMANSHGRLGRNEQALNMHRDLYSGYVRLNGEEHRETLIEALNYASSLGHLQHFEEARSLLRKTIPVARRVVGDGHELTLRLRWNYATVLYEDPAATLDDLRESVTTLEELGRTVRRVLGGAHPLVPDIEDTLKQSRITLRARETPSPG